MTNPLILAIDQGTTSSRAIVFDQHLNAVASAQQEFEQHFPQPGWVEHDPEDIWRTTLSTAQAAMQQAEAKGGKVVAIGVTNQRETTLLWDAQTLAPIGRAIVWQDRRTADICGQLKASGAEALIGDKTGLLLDPYFSATKIAWLLDNNEGARRGAAEGRVVAGTIDAFLIARLTGGHHFTDATNASRTSLYNIVDNEWDAELCTLFNVPVRCLPEVKDSADEFGDTLAEHFGRPIPVCSVIGDQQAAATGQGCAVPGDVKSTYGTGCFVLVQTGDELVRSRHRLLTTISRRVNGKTIYALEGSIFVAGAAVQWLRDALGIIKDAAETEAIAAGLQDNGGVYLVPAFAGLGAPHWAPDARGVISGLTRGSGREHIVRAALEAVCYQTADLLDAIAADGVTTGPLRVDGGMVANDWLLQFMADICNARVERPSNLETTAIGAAYLAGAHKGIYGAMSEVFSGGNFDTFQSSISDDARTKLVGGWRRALARTMDSQE